MKAKNLVHINSYYLSNKLHAELIENIEKNDNQINQFIFVPFLKGSISKKQIREENSKDFKRSTLILSDNFNKISRIIWPLKIWKIYKDYKVRFKNKQIDFTHSHSLISNGIISYLLYKKYNIPYFVTIRNTDINTFMKRFFLFRKLGEKILKKANGIIVLSPAYRDIQLKKVISQKIFNAIKHKISVIPNGVNDFWIENSVIKSTTTKEINILFVGKLRENKNILGVLQVCEILFKRGVKFTLNIAGDGLLKNHIINNTYSFNLNDLGHLNSKTELLEVYRNNHLLIVPSFKESFGLVYVEAMTQGLPVIYTKGQGFDGFFKDNEIGFSVTATDYNNMADKIQLIFKNYLELSKNATKKSKLFSWDNNSENLLNLYHTI